MPDTFISYSRKDKPFVQDLYDALAGHNRDIWVDWEDIPLTADWRAEIQAGIEASDTFIFVISPDSVASPVCAEEVAHAVAHHKRLVPILRRDVGAAAVPPPIGAHNWLFFRPQDDVQQALAALLQALDTDLEYVKSHTRLLTRALEWERAEEDGSLLLRGSDLRAAEEWLGREGQSKEPQPTPLQRQYVVESRRAATRRQRSLLGSVVVALVVTLMLATAALLQWQQALAARAVAEQRRQEAVHQANVAATAQSVAEAERTTAVAERSRAETQARRATSRQLAAQARQHLDSRLDQALLLSLQATQTDRTLEAQSSLLTSLVYSPRLTTFLRGHSQGVSTITFSPDGKLFVSSGYDGSIRLWDLVTRQSIGDPLSGQMRRIQSLAFSPDSPTVAAGGCLHLDADNYCEQGGVEVWNITTRQMLGEPIVGTSAEIDHVAFSPDGKLLAASSGVLDESRIMFWDIRSRQPVGEPLTGSEHGITDFAFSPDGRLLASGAMSACNACAEDQIIIWDLATRQPSGQPLEGHSYGVTSLAFSPDGMLLAAGGRDSTLSVWDVSTRQRRGLPLTGHTSTVQDVSFSPDGAELVSAGSDATILLWDVASGTSIGSPLRGHTDAVLGLAVSPDGSVLASGSNDATIALWDIADAVPLAQRVPGQSLSVGQLVFTPDGNGLAALGFTTSQASTAQYDVVVSDVASRQPRRKDVQGTASSVVLSPDARRLAVGREDGAIILRDVAGNAGSDHRLSGHRTTVTSIAFDPDGRLLASSSCARPGVGSAVCDLAEIRLWDLTTYRQIGEPLTAHTTFIEHLRIAPGGGRLVSSTNFEAMLWDLSSRQPIGQPLSGFTDWITDLAFSPDGKLLALAGMSTSSIGRASDQLNNNVTLWDAADGRQHGAPLSGYASGVRSVAFSATGTLLASGDFAGRIMLWDVRARQPIGVPLSGVDGSIESLAWSPRESRLASGSDDGRVLLWEVGLEAWQARGCRLVNRDFTAAEWSEFVGVDVPFRPTCPAATGALDTTSGAEDQGP